MRIINSTAHKQELEPNMARENEDHRAAAICKNCGTVHAARVGSDGEIYPIGTGQGPDCTCGDGDFHLVSDDADIQDTVNSKTPERN